MACIVVCMDCKINLDDNADFRQKEIFAKRDVTQEDEREVRASQFGLNYIGLEGSIGCLGKGTAPFLPWCGALPWPGRADVLPPPRPRRAFAPEQ